MGAVLRCYTISDKQVKQFYQAFVSCINIADDEEDRASATYGLAKLIEKFHHRLSEKQLSRCVNLFFEKLGDTFRICRSYGMFGLSKMLDARLVSPGEVSQELLGALSTQ